MSKSWQPYAHHILDMIAKVRRIEARGDITRDDILYDAALRSLQTLSEATQLLPVELNSNILIFDGRKSAVFAIFWCITTLAISM
ncbi:MAG TPA: hypothetical protein PKN72_00250 [Nitrosomonas europaea]|mgnify:CR=1 FL=1|nr:hypothetical protein [Nitrosomonas europaea]